MSFAGAPSRFQAIEFEAETNFGEDVAWSAPSRVLPITRVDTSGLSQEKVDPEAVYQVPNDSQLPFLGFIGGQITVEMYLTGHGPTAVGALTAHPLHTLLAAALGTGRTADVGGAVDGASAVGSVVASGTTFVPGSLMRVGALGDGFADGQWARVSAFAAGTSTLSTELPGVPQTSDDVGAALLSYPSIDSCEKVNSLRFRIYGINGQFEIYGCHCTNLAFSGLNAGEIPRVTFTLDVAWWRPRTVALTFPSTIATDMKVARAVGGGSLFLNTFGTATRQAYNLRSVELTPNFDVLQVNGYGGAHPQQRIQDAYIAGNSLSARLTFDKPVAGTSTFDDLWLAETFYHTLIGISVEDGKGLAVAMPKCKMIGDRPADEELDGLSRVSLELMSVAVSDTGATALERADWVLAQG